MRSRGETEYKIQVTVNSEDKTITVEDNGIGMTAEEVEEYINQIAFSGAQDFLAKYKDKANEDQIIGHFGLGFYSAFMVADKVTIDTLLIRKTQSRFTGSLRAALSLRWIRAIRKAMVPRLSFI